MTKISAAPGIYLILPLDEKSSVNLGKSSDKKLLKGKIVSVGDNRDHDQGGKMIATYKVGDIVFFLNYEANYDNFEAEIDGKTTKIYCTLFNDCRAQIK